MGVLIDLRATPSGGFAVHDVNDIKLRDPATQAELPLQRFTDHIQGRDLVLATHGFNVAAGHGTQALRDWEPLAQLPPHCAWVGVLWPGDSVLLPVLDYPIEGAVAIASGKLLADFLNLHAGQAASISLVSHSLGARTVLETVAHLAFPVAHLILMAGAIEDDTLTQEYATAKAKVASTQVVASRRDWVLEFAFPLGNPVGEFIMRGHPYFRAALGRHGPANLAALAGTRLWQLPDGSGPQGQDWDYGHGDYLPADARAAPLPLPTPPLSPQSTEPPHPAGDTHWKAAWSAGVIGTPFN